MFLISRIEGTLYATPKGDQMTGEDEVANHRNEIGDPAATGRRHEPRRWASRWRRFNRLANPGGWERDINFDVPWWKAAVTGAFLPVVLIGLHLLSGRPFTPGAVALILLAGLPIWLIPPLRALYLRGRARPDGGES